MQTANAAVAL